MTYYGRTPSVREELARLGDTTPYGFGFWVAEILIGIVIPVLP